MNRAVMYQGPGKDVAVENRPYPTFVVPDGPQAGRKCPHGAIVKLIATCICGSDCHMVRGRTGAPDHPQLGHEMFGEVVEVGPDVEFVKVGDVVSIPFNTACGRCRNCKRMFSNACEYTNPKMPGGGYGYVGLGGWPGGQSNFNLIPYADWNLLVIPDARKHVDKWLDLALLSDVIPTAYDACFRGMVRPGSRVYIAGAGPIGLAAAAICMQILGAAKVIVADYEASRLAQAKAIGAETLHLSPVTKTVHGMTAFVRSIAGEHGTIADALMKTFGTDEIDVGIDAAGFECNGRHGMSRFTDPQRAEVINDLFRVVRPTGFVAIPGVYTQADKGATETLGKAGGLALEDGVAWEKGLSIVQGQAPIGTYNRELMRAILGGRLQVAKYLNPTVITLEQAPQAYKTFMEGEARKYYIDPNGMLAAAGYSTFQHA